jgi:hypothetical protein
MSKHVVLTAMLQEYNGPTDGVELWGVNCTYKHQPNVTRLYFFDSIENFHAEFVDDVNALGIPVYGRHAYPQLTNGRKFPLDEVMAEFWGVQYFTCTVAYMIAHALFEGYERITLNGMYHPMDSLEYMAAKPCVDFWCGVALGRGVNLEIRGETALCKPMPWDPSLYGYQYNGNGALASATISAAYTACMNYPRLWKSADDHGPNLGQDFGSIMGARAALQRQLNEIDQSLLSRVDLPSPESMEAAQSVSAVQI